MGLVTGILLSIAFCAGVAALQQEAQQQQRLLLLFADHLQAVGQARRAPQFAPAEEAARVAHQAEVVLPRKALPAPAPAPTHQPGPAGKGAIDLRAEQRRIEAQRLTEAQRRALLGLTDLAHRYLAMGDFPGAIHACDCARALDSKAADTEVIAAQALEGIGKRDEARAHYLAALALDPGHAEAHWLLGRLYSGDKQLEAAMAQYRTAAQLQPDMARAHYSLGVILGRLGQVEEGLAELVRARTLDPSLPDLDRNLAILYIAMTSTAPERAAQHLQKLSPEVQASLKESLQRLSEPTPGSPPGPRPNRSASPKTPGGR
jgi:tetratricopeptide (TPR) repeat protein